MKKITHYSRVALDTLVFSLSGLALGAAGMFSFFFLMTAFPDAGTVVVPPTLHGPQIAFAAPPAGYTELKGFAWAGSHNSGTIGSPDIGSGWISFNRKDCDTDGDGDNDVAACGPLGSAVPDYQVSVDTSNYSNEPPNPTTGDFTGYAWSPNIGWISFNPADLVGCPVGAANLDGDGTTCEATINWYNGTVAGWARVLSNDTAAGWSGWIRLDLPVPYGGYSVKPAFTGYAWSADNIGGSPTPGIGWISFSSFDCDTDQNGTISGGLPACGTTGNPIAQYGVTLGSIAPGLPIVFAPTEIVLDTPPGYAQANLIYESYNGFYPIDPDDEPVQYGFDWDGDGLGYVWETNPVNGLPVYIGAPGTGGTSTPRWTTLGMKTFNVKLRDGDLNESAVRSYSINVIPPPPTATFTVQPTNALGTGITGSTVGILDGGTPGAFLYSWTSNHTTSCAVTRNPGSVAVASSGSSNSSGSGADTPATNTTQYSITCQGLPFSNPASVTINRSVTVNTTCWNNIDDDPAGRIGNGLCDYPSQSCPGVIAGDPNCMDPDPATYPHEGGTGVAAACGNGVCNVEAGEGPFTCTTDCRQNFQER